MQEPICGWKWFDKNRHKHTQAEIDSLGIEIMVDDKLQGHVLSGEKKARSIVREIVKVNK